MSLLANLLLVPIMLAAVAAHVLEDQVSYLQRANCKSKLQEPRLYSVWKEVVQCAVTERESVRIALAFYGLFRSSANETLRTMEANLFEPLRDAGEFDVFVHALLTPVDESTRNANHGSLVDPKEYRHFKPCVVQVESQAIVDDRLRAVYQKATLVNGSNLTTLKLAQLQLTGHRTPYDRETTLNVIRSRYSIGRAADLIRAREIETGVKYTHVVVARPDVAFFSKLHWSPLPDAIRVPNFGMWGGVNDRFAYGPAEIMLNGCMSQFDKQFLGPNFSWDPGNRMISEQLMCKHLYQQHVRVAVTPLCLVRLRGAKGWPEHADFKRNRERAPCLGDKMVASGPEDFHDPCK